MISDDTHLLLSLDNIEEAKELTGLTKKELLETFRQCNNFDQTQVYWKNGEYWFGMRVDNKFLTPEGELQTIIKEMMNDHAKRLL
jgi:hypothetical protein